MPEIIRPSGVRISTPTGIIVADTILRPARRTRTARTDETADPETVALVRALDDQEFEVVDQLDLVAAAAPRTRARRGSEARRTDGDVKIDVKLRADENAVVLIEDEGEYRWLIPEPPSRGSRTRSLRRGGRTSRHATFSIRVRGTAGAPTSLRRRRGAIEEIVLGRVRAFILRFVARKLGKHLLKRLEKSIETGLVHVTSSSDVAKWRRLDDAASVKIPSSAGRVLLLVHGTFSSTAGSYGALTHTEFGQRLLDNILRNYTAVIGWDHRTLSEDPRENAKALLARLKRLGWPADTVFDAISFSRGGLVLRTLIEELLPNSGWRPRFDRIVFVGCTNEGTHLAEPDNWRMLLDLYTNLAAGACRGLALVPGAAPFARVFGEIIKGVGALAKYIAEYVIEENGAPGLAAMRPKGKFVTELNAHQAGQPTPHDSYYCAVTTDFEARLALQDVTKTGLAPKLLTKLVDGFVDKLMKNASNDLVVHVESMTAIDRATGDFIKDSHAYGENGLVYHTNYFSQPQTAAAITRWLRLGAGEQMVTSDFPGAPPRPPQDRWAVPIVMAGSSARSTPASAVNTNILVVDDDEAPGLVLKNVKLRNADFLIVRRDQKHETLVYAITAGELAGVARGVPYKHSLGSVIDVHEYRPSFTSDLKDIDTIVPKRPRGSDPIGSRTVVLDHGDFVGVVPASNDLEDFVKFGSLATTKTMRRRRSGAGSLAASPPRVGASRPKGAASPSRSAAPESNKDQVQCFFQAEIDEQILVDTNATVDVTVSREAIETAARAVAMRGRATVRTDRPIDVQVIPKKNFSLPGDGAQETRADITRISVPEPGIAERLSFEVSATSVGDGEVWVQARQDRLPLVTLKLRVEIVDQPVTRARKTRAAVTVANLPEPRKAIDTLRITEQINNNQVRYDFDVELVSLEKPRRFRGYSDPIQGDREQYIQDIYKDIENRWSHNQASFDAFQRDLQSIGMGLFKSLVPPELRKLLWINRNEIKHIQVLSTEPFIPWELVYVTDPDERTVSDDGCFLGEMGLVRWLYEDFAPAALRVRRGRARYVAPEYPLEHDRLTAREDEIKVVMENFHDATEVDSVADVVYELLRQPGKFDLLHFICHGQADSTRPDAAKLKMKGWIVDGEYREDVVYAGTVERHGKLRSEGNPLPIVILNACQSARLGYTLTGIGGFAQAFVRAGAGAFIGTHWAVGDGVALTFITKFYNAFKDEGKTLAESVSAAREAAKTAGDSTWLAYTVYGEPYATLNT